MTGETTEFLYLNTRGRRSGEPRETEVWFIERGGCYYVIAEHGASAHWVQNLQAHASVTVRVADRTFPARARIVDGATERELSEAIRALSEAKYGWGQGLVIELDPGGKTHRLGNPIGLITFRREGSKQC